MAGSWLAGVRRHFAARENDSMAGSDLIELFEPRERV
jgi:hypothetical protein